MSLPSPFESYAEQVGGMIDYKDMCAIPFNHWRKDYEWIVLVVPATGWGAFIPVEALTHKEACDTAIQKYLLMEEPDA